MLEDMKIQDDNKEFDIAKYAPVIKAVAALGVGLASDSPMARGISEGLAKSAKSDVERRRLQEEVQREQNKLEAEARQKKLKTELDLIWKVGQEIKDPVARYKYFDQTNYYTKAGVMAPDAPAPGAEVPPIDFSATDKVVKSKNMSETQLSLYNGFKATAINLHTQGDYAGAAVAQNRAFETIKDPARMIMWNADGEYRTFTSKGEAADAGFPFTSHASATGVSPSDQYIKDAQPLVDSNNKLVKGFTDNMLKHGSVDLWGGQEVYDYYNNFMLGADNARKVNALAGINGSPPIVSYNTPFPNLIMDSYEWAAAGEMLRDMTIVIDQTDPEALKAILGADSFQEALKEKAEEARASDGGYVLTKSGGNQAPAVETTTTDPNATDFVQLVTDAARSDVIDITDEKAIIEFLVKNGMKRAEAKQWVKDNS